MEIFVVVPAHNEELLLGNTLESLEALSYSRSDYEVVVIADNCEDQTAEIARSRDVSVLERCDPEQRGKGQALHWAMTEHLRDWPAPYDAVIVLDADSMVNADFLWFMNEKLTQGHEILQGYYGVQNPTESWRTSLATASLAAFHFFIAHIRRHDQNSVTLSFRSPPIAHDHSI